MSITEKTLTTLEFDKIRTLLRDCCPTSGAKRCCQYHIHNVRLPHLLSEISGEVPSAADKSIRTTDTLSLPDANALRGISTKGVMLSEYTVASLSESC